MKIDNFALTMHQTCPLKFWYRMEQGWQLRRRSGALGFGAAFHAGIAARYKNLEASSEEKLKLGLAAIAEGWDNSVPVDDYRTLAKCCDVYREYNNEYTSEGFTVIGAPYKPIVEQTFTLALGTYLQCQNVGCHNSFDRQGLKDITNPMCEFCLMPREAIEYGGIFDTLVEFSGKAFVLEHKTTSQLGDYYFNQFKPNNQITGYIWAAQQLSGMTVAGAIVNAIGAYRVGKTKFKRQVTTRDSLDIEQWVRNVTASCEEIVQHRRNAMWPQRTINCTQYGLCEFHQVDTLSDPTWREKRLEQDYVKATWDYTKRDDNAEGTPA